MRTKQYCLIILIILCMIMIVVSCSQSASAILGKWSTSYASLEFFKDNTCILNIGDERLPGKWQILEDKRIKIDIAGPLGTPQTTFARVEGKSLTLDKRILGMMIGTRDNTKFQKAD